MPQRDTGWGQVFAQNGQEVFDLTLQAFKVSENHGVQLPIMVNMDGFIVSHMIEAIEMLDHNEVNSFLPAMNPRRMLDTKAPRTIGAFGAQNIYTEVKKAQDVALHHSAEIWREVWQEYGDKFGHHYSAVDSFCTEDADIVFVTMGSISETARSAVISMREEGEKVGLVNIRLWRPFPEAELKQAIGNVKTIAVIDRMLSPGSQAGPVGLEIRSAYSSESICPKIHDFVMGLGGRQISRKTFKQLITDIKTNVYLPEKYHLYDARTK